MPLKYHKQMYLSIWVYWVEAFGETWDSKIDEEFYDFYYKASAAFYRNSALKLKGRYMRIY